MNRYTPRCFIAVILDWYSKCSASVRWNNYDSNSFNICAGVRQGGVLSPLLFAIFIDDIIDKVKHWGYGLEIRNCFMGCIIYADDILLISRSVTFMQKLLDLCSEFMNCIDMSFNVKKSVVIGIEPRWRCHCADLVLSNESLFYVESIKYLGVVFKSGIHFSCSYEHVKLAFYRAFNALFSRSKNGTSELITIFLLRSFCLPIILYSLKATNPSPSNLRMLDNLLSNAVIKIFNITDKSNVTYIRKMVNLCDISLLSRASTCKFLVTFATKPLFCSCKF